MENVSFLRTIIVPYLTIKKDALNAKKDSIYFGIQETVLTSHLSMKIMNILSYQWLNYSLQDVNKILMFPIPCICQENVIHVVIEFHFALLAILMIMASLYNATCVKNHLKFQLINFLAKFLIAIF